MDHSYERPPPPTSAAVVAAPRVEVRRSARRSKTVTAYRERDAIVVLIPQRMSQADERRFVSDMVAKVLAREARTRVSPREDALFVRALDLLDQHLRPVVPEIGDPASVSWVTNQDRRWGSCTPELRTIRLSHRLQQMPSWVVDYVLVHELVHLIEPTHTARFWRLADRYPMAARAKGFLEGWQAALGQRPEVADVDR